MGLPLAGRWFERRSGDDITLLWEPHVIPLMRCNIWRAAARDDAPPVTVCGKLAVLAATVSTRR